MTVKKRRRVGDESLKVGDKKLKVGDKKLKVGAKKGLDPTAYDDWLTSLEKTESHSSSGPLLAWAQAADGGMCIASRGYLSLRIRQAETDDQQADRWQHLGWHQIERGSFDADARRLSWTTYTSSRGHVVLPEPGRVPQVFRERVAASIAVEEFIPAENRSDARRGVTVSGRRDLTGSDSTIVWHASLSKDVTWETPGIGELADAAVARLRAEYDPQG